MKLTPYAKDLLSRYPMTIDEALRRARPGFGNVQMIKALQLCTWHNSIEDEKRLVSAIIIERSKNKIAYDPKRGYHAATL